MRTRYVDIDDRMEDLAERMRHDPESAADFLHRYELSWLYHENALEGVVYTGQEIEAALSNQPLAEASAVATLRDIRNFKAAIDVVRAEAIAHERPERRVRLGAEHRARRGARRREFLLLVRLVVPRARGGHRNAERLQLDRS